MRRCLTCSSQAPDDSRFCPACGAPLDASSQTPTLFLPLLFLVVLLLLCILLRRQGLAIGVDLTSWYAGNTVLVALVTAALAAYGLRMSLAGRRIHRDAVLEG